MLDEFSDMQKYAVTVYFKVLDMILNPKEMHIIHN
jgi:hypothetical protein